MADKKTYDVTVCFSGDGIIQVEASSKEEALVLAKEAYGGLESLKFRCIQVDFPVEKEDIDDLIYEHEEDED